MKVHKLFEENDILKGAENFKKELIFKMSKEKSIPRKQRLQAQLKQVDEHIANLKKKQAKDKAGK